jgi:hypothetical protein
MNNYLKKNFYFFKLINKLQRNGKKYKLYNININTFFFLIYIYRYFKIRVTGNHLIDKFDSELNLNLLIFILKRRKVITNKFLKINKRLKEFIKLFFILLFKQKFRSIKFRLLLLIIEIFFFFNNNIFSTIKNKIFQNIHLKKKKIKLIRSYLGNLKLLNMLSIIIISLFMLIFILIIKNVIFIKKLFFKIFKYFLYRKNIFFDYVSNLLFDYNIQNKNNLNLLNQKLNFNNLIIFFQFGSKKHAYFKSWYNNIKRKKY